MFPDVNSFRKSGIEFLNFRWKIYTAIAVFLITFIMVGSYIFKDYQRYQSELLIIKKNNLQLDYIQEIKSRTNSILSKAVAAVRNHKTVDTGDVSYLNTRINRLKSELGNKTSKVTACNDDYVTMILYHNIFEMDKNNYQELKRINQKYNKAITDLERYVIQIQNHHYLKLIQEFLIALGLLFLFALLGAWLIYEAVRTIIEPTILIKKHLQSQVAEEYTFFSLEGLGAAASFLQESQSIWKQNLLEELKKIANRITEESEELTLEIKAQELSEIQLIETHKVIKNYIEEQIKMAEKANEQVIFLVSNLESLQKIPSQLLELIAKVQALLNTMEPKLTEVLNTTLNFEDSSGQITTLFGEINFTATKINEVIGILNEVSGQTELLAFNTAIEAARAGSKGLGFGVVSREITKLVERSKKAASDLDLSLIQLQTSMSKVNDLLPQAVINKEITITFQNDVTSICNQIFSTTRNSIQDLSKLGLVFEDIISISGEINQEAIQISQLDFKEKQYLDKMGLEILDYQLNVKEAVRIANKAGESAQELQKSLAKFEVQAS